MFTLTIVFQVLFGWEFKVTEYRTYDTSIACESDWLTVRRKNVFVIPYLPDAWLRVKHECETNNEA